MSALLFTVQELSVSERQRRQAQQERDEMADEMVNNSSGKSVSLHVYTCYKCVISVINVTHFVAQVGTAG